MQHTFKDVMNQYKTQFQTLQYQTVSIGSQNNYTATQTKRQTSTMQYTLNYVTIQ